MARQEDVSRLKWAWSWVKVWALRAGDSLVDFFDPPPANRADLAKCERWLERTIRDVTILKETENKKDIAKMVIASGKELFSTISVTDAMEQGVRELVFGGGQGGRQSISNLCDMTEIRVEDLLPEGSFRSLVMGMTNATGALSSAARALGIGEKGKGRQAAGRSGDHGHSRDDAHDAAEGAHSRRGGAAGFADRAGALREEREQHAAAETKPEKRGMWDTVKSALGGSNSAADTEATREARDAASAAQRKREAGAEERRRKFRQKVEDNMARKKDSQGGGRP